ncbi:MAG: hypothetical protein JXR39_10955 [Marinilabiliaceae bacterium]|nr:hypothetical protein [Marinilabiliaceae bacterium]
MRSFSKSIRIFVFQGLIGLLILSASCRQSSNDPLNIPVVDIEGKVLTQRDLYEAVPHNMSKEDSLVFVQDYITRWVKTQLQLRKAELNLTEEEKNIEKLLDDYRTSLLTHQYQQKLLEQKYAPMITSSEVERYYAEMKENFPLREVIIKGIFIKMPLTAPNLQQFEPFIRSKKPADMLEVEGYCIQNAKKFDQFIDRWIPFSQINKELPNRVDDPSALLRSQLYYTDQDLEFKYYLVVHEVVFDDELAPLEYASERIKSILLNKKRVEFIQQLEEDLYEEGLEQKIVKFY